jgi:flagellar hook-associated protein 2
VSGTSSISGGTTSGSSATSGTLGDAPPVSFPGVASGIDYNSIIEKYTAETLQQEAPTKAQINNLNSANTAILKIQSLIGNVQNTLTALSNPNLFNAYTPTVANTASGATAATAKQIAGQQPIAGTYVINAQTVATATQIANSTAANGALNTGVAIDQAGTAITPTNGTSATGSLTINGVQIHFDVTSTTLDDPTHNSPTSLVGIINNAGIPGVTASIVGGKFQLTGVTSLGSGADSGNILQVLKLDTAQIPSGGGTITSTSPIAGINATALLNASGNAGFATGVTAGTFTINGVQLTVDPTKESLSDVLNAINSSSAGVVATYNSQTSSITLTSTTPGPHSILLGASADTSNFLSATGLSSGTTTAGTQASLTYTDTTGQHTVYSATNDFTSAIPGVDLTVTQSSPSSLLPTDTYYTVGVAADPTKAEAAITSFINAYNKVIVELNNDTKAPSVSTGTGADGTSTSSQTSAGGVLYGNYQISSLRDQLVQLVSGFIPTGSAAYNSLQSVGITLDTSSVSVGSSNANDASDSTDSSDSNSGTNASNFTVNATSGQLSALDKTTFEAAYAANSIAVSNLFTQTPLLTTSNTSAVQSGEPGPNDQYGAAYAIGAFLSNADGLSTFLQDTAITPNLAGVLLTSVLDTNNAQIKNLQSQVDLITKEANQQADSLRAQYSASESQIAELQGLQQQIAAIGH